MKRYPHTQDHQNHDGHQWLDDLLDDVVAGRIEKGISPEIDRVTAVSPDLQIAVLKACVERMPWYRENKLEREGSTCYVIACYLYHCDLPFSEADICSLLKLSKHRCGHGEDVVEPFDLMYYYVREHGATAALMDATRQYAASLAKVKSIRAQNARTNSALVLLLDRDRLEPPDKCWSDRFRTGLRALPDEELRHWERLVLDLSPTMRTEMPKSARKRLEYFLECVAPETVLKRLSEWLPDPEQSSVARIDTGGSHFLKHLIWLLEVIADDTEYASVADSLVCRLPALDWKPGAKAQKALLASAFYLVKRPPDVSWLPLKKIEEWNRKVQKNAFTGSKLEGLISQYRKEHSLAIPSD
ncbi:MAG: hypothetical protein KC777_09485 [Cyanobacteria bacterium HKST-UBA02]|nr:hypothetical protein [Cyanobacteria bacterium HKST-UBA02]